MKEAFIPKQPQRIYYILAALALLVFFGVMLQFVNMPYFWDELGVYFNAVFWQYDHSLSLLPGSVPVEFSRGHPLLFPFIYATVLKVFGPHLWVGHAFSLLVSVAVAITTFVIAKRHISLQAGLFALLFLLPQPLFVAQSTMLLPEMLLSLWVILTVKAMIEKRYGWYFLFASIAFLTKESAIILPFVAIASSLVNSLLLRKKPFIRWKEWLIYLSPLLVFGAFLGVQRIQNGWYFFPYHTGFISFEWNSVHTKLYDYSNFLFFGQGRLVMAIMFGLALVQVLYFRFAKKERYKIRELHVVVFFMIVGMLAFSSVNFYMNRYLLFLMPIICLLAASALDSLRIGPWLRALVLIICLLPFIGKMSTPGFDYDNNMNYRYLVHMQKEATHYFEENHLTDKAIDPGFPIVSGLFDVRAGYLEGKPFPNLVFDADNADYVCVFVYYDMNSSMPHDHGVELLKSFQENKEEVRIYKVLR